ncbi:hypothetical protein PG989_002152 [Apiospora arundinis]
MNQLPHGQFTREVCTRLSQALWSGGLCQKCLNPNNDGTSPGCECPVSRARRYFRFYETVIQDYHDATSSPIFKTHHDIFRVIVHLRTNPQLTRRELREFIAPSCSDVEELDRSTALVVRIQAMLECSIGYQSGGRLEKGLSSLPWNDDSSIASYVNAAFAIQNQRPLWDSDLRHGSKSTLRATKLRRRLKLRFRPTHDIRNHLRLDLHRGELEIFHHAAFLKEQLRASPPARDRSNGASDPPPLLPRQLLLEILDSLQRILFPLDDAASKKLLRRLIESPDTNFDPSLLQFEYSSLHRHRDTASSVAALGRRQSNKAYSTTGRDQGGVQYLYLAARLSELREELDNPSPRGWLQRRLQRRSSARYVMMVTLAGVVFAVLSLVMSAIQTWIAYQAWKAPNNPSTP